MKMKAYLTLLCTFYAASMLAQEKDSTFFFHTDLSVTNNGFSIIPAFTLGDPAAFLDMRMGNKRLSFEPQFRYAIEGRPWSFVFIYRYKAILKPKFQVSVGGHLPGINYVKAPVTIGSITENLSVARRFLAAEIIPTYKISTRTSVGFYYLRGHGFQHHGPQNTNFLALQGNFTKIKLVGKSYVNFNPQVFYLKVDAHDGFYVNATTTLGVQDFPLTISCIVNKTIDSTIPTKNFDWNVSLIYTLHKNYTL
ncbi:MAG: hypothetical protein KF775_02900 [Cyclobacteriaceae bacterium]|nr:hypothetical protein [Cyclobacteriaceae bacterium]